MEARRPRCHTEGMPSPPAPPPHNSVIKYDQTVPCPTIATRTQHSCFRSQTSMFVHPSFRCNYFLCVDCQFSTYQAPASHQGSPYPTTKKITIDVQFRPGMAHAGAYCAVSGPRACMREELTMNTTVLLSDSRL